MFLNLKITRLKVLVSLLNQKTIKNPVSFSGVGLHSGKPAKICVKPSSPDTVIVFKRIDLKYTRAMISAILNDKLNNVEYTKHVVFGLKMPTSCPNVPSEILNPRNTWKDKNKYDNKANELAHAFNTNFNQFSDYASKEILDAAPRSIINK